MKTSLRKTLITTTAATLSLVSVGMIAVVAYLQLNLSQSQLESDEALITEALESKGKILSSSHALALRGFVEANAISDVRDMVTRAVNEDQSVVYGLFLDADLNPWAYQAPNSAEGAGAAGIAAIYGNPDMFTGKKVGAVICGGNIDPRLLASILNRNMAVDGRIARLRIDISDEPGMLAAISTAIGKCGGNIVEIYHQRLFYDVPAKLAKIDAVIETRGPAHVDEIIAALRAANFQVRQLEDSAS